MKTRRANFPGSPARSRRRGFTLMELVVTLGMIVLIAAVLYPTIKIAYGATTGTEANLEPPSNAAIALDIVQTDLVNSLSPGGAMAQDFEGTQNTDERGHENDDIVCFSTAPAPNAIDANGDIKQIELTVEGPGNSTQRDHVLVRRVTRNLLAIQQETPVDEILCRGVSAFTVTYFTGSQWLPSWDSTEQDNTLPAAVQIVLELQRTDPGSNQPKIFRYVRQFSLPCSTAAQDPAVNSGIMLP